MRFCLVSLSALLLRVVSDESVSASPRSLSKDESYLEPYLEELIDYRSTTIAKRFVSLAGWADVAPTWLFDLIVPLVLRGSQATVPIAGHPWFSPFDKPYRIDLPIGKEDLSATASLENLTVKDLNQFTHLKPIKLLDTGKFTWGGSVATKRMEIVAPLIFNAWGLTSSLTAHVTVSDLKVEYAAIIALNRSRTCHVWGESMQSSLHCAVWPMANHETAGMSGLNVTELELSVKDYDIKLEFKGLSILDQYLNELFSWVVSKGKASIIAELPGPLSRLLKVLANRAVLHAVPSFQRYNPCLPQSTSVPSKAIHVSKICITNKGWYDLKWGVLDCPAHGVSNQTSAYPILQSRCMDVKSVLPHVVDGEILRASTHAILGIHEIIDPPIRYKPDSNVADFVCRGTTYTMKCELLSVEPFNRSITTEPQESFFV